MQIDIILNEFTSARENAELAALAESYGARAVWSASYASERNAFMSMVGAAEKTNRVRLGPLAVSPMEMHPLVMSNMHKPSSEGAVIYLNANPDLQAVLDKIQEAGGKVDIPKTQITEDFGYMAFLTDTEGNKVALHSQG